MLHNLVHFPHSDKLKGQINENIFPDEHEYEFTAKTQVGEISALSYFKELAADYGLPIFSDNELAMFIQRMLPIYCHYETALKSIDLGKQYDARIVKADLKRFYQQAANCAEMYACLSAAQALRNIHRKNAIVNESDIEKVEQLRDLFHQYHRRCGSCRSREQYDSAVVDFCYNFSEQVLVNWNELHGNPFLIFRLWTTVAQTPFANESTDSLAALLDRKCKTKQT